MNRIKRLFSRDGVALPFLAVAVLDGDRRKAANPIV
jgi:hypothetical protein